MIYVRILHLYAFVTKYDIGPSPQRYILNSCDLWFCYLMLVQRTL